MNRTIPHVPQGWHIFEKIFTKYDCCIWWFCLSPIKIYYINILHNHICFCTKASILGHTLKYNFAIFSFFPSAIENSRYIVFSPNLTLYNANDNFWFLNYFLIHLHYWVSKDVLRNIRVFEKKNCNCKNSVNWSYLLMKQTYQLF